MKKSNLLLFVLLAVLLGIFAFSQFMDSGKTKRTFRNTLVDIDTAAVTEIRIDPANEGPSYSIRRVDSGWELQADGEDAQLADVNIIKGLLSILPTVKPKRLAAKGESKWAEFQVDDAGASRITVKEGSDTSLDLMIGKFSVNPQKTPPQGMPGAGGQMDPRMMQQQQQPQVTSYVRVSGETEVYAVDGMLSMALNRQAKDFLPPEPKPEVSDSLSVE